MSFNQPTDDPLPWVTDRMRRLGVFQFDLEREQYGDWYQSIDPDTGAPLWKRPTIEKRRMTGAAASALLDILTQAVSALHDDAKSYTVVLSKNTATAGTLLEKKVVEVGSKPMNDDDLTDGQKAAVMAGLALHEVGHIRFARQYAAAITRLFGAGKVTGAINTLSNLAADLHDESAVCSVFPGLAPSVAVTLWWVGNKGQVDTGATIDQMLAHGAVARVNAAIAATRYPWTAEWNTQTSHDWLTWWVEWAGRAAQADKPKDHALIVQEAIEKIREGGLEDLEPPIPPDGPGPTCGPDGPKREPKPGEEPKGEGKGQGQDRSDDEPKPGDKPGSGNGDDEPKPGAGDEPGDDEGKGEGKGDEKGDKPGDQPGDGGKPEPDDGTEAKDAPVGKSGGQGASTGGDGSPYDANENAPGAKDACVKPAADGGYEDEKLQRGADKITRGKRAGMRRRHYNHSTSVHGAYSGGRTVVSIPRKGKRFVWDV